jgi:membrane-associated HD superfamily phosphohydrolase
MTGLGVFGIGGSFSPWNFELYLLIGLGLIMLSLLVYVLKYHQEERHHKSLLILPAILLPAILLRGTMEIVDFEAFSFILLLGAALALPSLDKALELLTDRRRSIFQLSGNALALAVLILGLFQWNWEDGIVMGTYSFLKEALADPWLIFIHALAVFGLVWGILRFVKTRQPEIAGLTMAALFSAAFLFLMNSCILWHPYSRCYWGST